MTIINGGRDLESRKENERDQGSKGGIVLNKKRMNVSR